MIQQPFAILDHRVAVGLQLGGFVKKVSLPRIAQQGKPPGVIQVDDGAGIELQCLLEEPVEEPPVSRPSQSLGKPVGQSVVDLAGAERDLESTGGFLTGLLEEGPV